MERYTTTRRNGTGGCSGDRPAAPLFRYPAVLLAVLLLCAASCIREDWGICTREASRSVVLSFEPGDGDLWNAGTYSGAADQATLYVYDLDGRFLAMQTWHNLQFGREYPLGVDLPDGTYNFVVWVNHEHPCFEIPAFFNYPEVKPGKAESELLLQIPPHGIVNYALPQLLHGKLDYETVTGNHTLVVPLTQMTNAVVLSVEGLERTRDDYTFTIADDNGAYDFDGRFAPSSAFRYTADASFNSGLLSLCATITVMKLAADRNPVITLDNRTSGQTIYPSYAGQEASLVRLIQKAYGGAGFDFDRRHVFYIVISFDAQMTATVTVDGWKVVESNDELFPD